MSEYDTDCSDNTTKTNISGLSFETADTVPCKKFDTAFFNNSKLHGYMFYEPFHKQRLITVLKDYDQYEHLLIHSKKMDFHEEFDIKQMIQLCLKNAGQKDYLTVTYSKSRNSPKHDGKFIGRWFANKWVGLQYMPRCLRHALCGSAGSDSHKDLWMDLDMVNAHPTLALHLFKLYNLNTKYLEEYINDRERILREIIEKTDCTRDEAKTLLLKILNGGADKTFIPWRKEFFREVQHNLETVSILPEFAFIRRKITQRSDGKYNIPAKTVNQIICAMENYILELFTLKLIEDGVIPAFKNGYKCVLIHDGLQVPWTEENEERMRDLTKYEEFIKQKTGIEIKLKVKPFDEYMTIREEVENKLDHLNLKTLAELSEYDYEDVKTVFERECAKIMDPIMYIQNSNNNIVMRNKEKLKDAFANIKYKGFNERKGTHEEMPFINEWLTDTRMRTYERLDFIPAQTPANVYNIWTGFDVPLETPLPDDFNIEDNDYIRRYLKHIDMVVGSDEISTYIKCWIAHKLQKPGVKTCVCLLFYSIEEGTGDKYSIELEENTGIYYVL
ncbi:hypothetical protein GUITHDRAFT_148693 [Guillardia theta CCMP2712]|uniref:Uncharacterized protein n=1 Tax=Guillardia theta (strain CCMP2712) TaxID=905079 RepID=L1I7V2_GUITC|nr:hypothetical protein GUITHDRAFT_148693 [Guillardia theta CCMP2712]EKX32326.1 hypothetical protein GUITHDRAFT_148693 [Guillardia theta CCMP2712]|eukprot:XP_005819306.1 hypothetical protein GUITHDRAFT_148693 [Guillardia theta CCMP2712]